MKKIILMAIIATAFGCKKEKIQIPPTPPVSNPSTIKVTFKKDSSIADFVTQVPKNNQLLSGWVFNSGSLNGLSIINVRFTPIRSGDAAMPADYLTNTYFVIETPVNYVSEVKATILNSENNFNNFVKNMPQFKSYGIKFYGNVSSLATNNTGLSDGLSFKVVISYTGYEGNNSQISYFETEIITGQNITFSILPQPLTLTTSLDVSNPSGSTILDGQEKTGLAYGVKPTGSAANITEHKFKIQGQSALAVQVLKLFDGATLVAQAPVVAGSVTIFSNIAVPENTTKVFTVKAFVSSVYSDISGYDFNIVLDKVSATSVTTSNTAFDDVDRISNNFDVLKAQLEIKKVPVPTLQIVNGSMMELYIVDLTAVNGDVSLKELSYNLLLNDQGINDTLFAKNFQILNGSGVDITSQFRFTDLNSNIDTLFSESDSKLRTTRISGTGETIIPSGTTLRLRFRAFVGGFNHPLDGDGFSVIPALDVASSVGLKNLNTGGLTSGNAKLHSSSSPSGSAQNFNIIWSDYSSFSHNGQFGQTSNDWIGGQKVIANISVNNFYQ
jgi:hypothetical protein